MSKNNTDRQVSIVDIAERAGVSKTTVSFILNGKAEEHRISAETIKRVQDIIREFHFEPNEFARGFRLKQTKTIGLVIGDINNRFLSQLEKTIEIEARNQGYNLIISSSEDDAELENKVIDTLLHRVVEALILVSVHSDNQKHLELNKRSIPVVYVDRKIDGKDLLSVTSDNQLGAYQLTEHFIEQSINRIAFIGGLEHLSTNSERFSGFHNAFNANHLQVDSSLVVHGEFTAEGAFASSQKLFESLDQYPEAIFTASYTILEGLLAYLKQYHPEGLEKIRIATFDDHPLLDYLPFKINSAVQDSELMGTTAFDLVMRLLKGETDMKPVVIPPKLIFRDKLI